MTQHDLEIAEGPSDVYIVLPVSCEGCTHLVRSVNLPGTKTPVYLCAFDRRHAEPVRFCSSCDDYEPED